MKKIIIITISTIAIMTGCSREPIKIPKNLSSLPEVTTVKLYNSFAENEVAAKKKYYHKPFILITKPTKIEETLGGDPDIIEVLGKDIYATISLTKIDSDKVAKLENGQKTKLYCNGSIWISVGELSVKDCRTIK